MTANQRKGTNNKEPMGTQSTMKQTESSGEIGSDQVVISFGLFASECAWLYAIFLDQSQSEVKQNQ